MLVSREQIESDISAFAREFDGRISLKARDLKTGETIALHADRKCPTASVIKLPILVHAMMLVHEGALFLDEILIVGQPDQTPGSGILTHLSAGHRLCVEDACVLMIALSDNTATNLMIDRMGIEGINERMRVLGLKETTLHRKVFATGPPVSAANAKYGLGATTPRETVRLLAMIHSGELGSPETCRKIRSVLSKQQYRDAIPRYLSASCRFEGKSGAVDHVRNDCGIVTTASGNEIALAVFVSDIPKVLWTADNPGQLAIARVSKMLIEYFEAR